MENVIEEQVYGAQSRGGDDNVLGDNVSRLFGGRITSNDGVGGRGRNVGGVREIHVLWEKEDRAD